jgi:ethanolamine permease
VATFLVDVAAALWTLAAYGAFLAYFALYSRHHLVASAPEEEFELLADAEEDVR